MSTAVLLAESEPGTRGFLERHLADDGFDVVPATEPAEALELAERACPDLVLVGDMTPLELCRRIREGEPGRAWNRDVPVIVIGPSEADAVDRVRAFDRGCDDFVPRPFVYDELVARMRAVLRRVSPKRERIAAGELVIDTTTRGVFVRGQLTHLASKEYDLLLKLASDPKRVFTKEELLRDVWGFRSQGRTRTLDSHASRLRRKLTGGTRRYVVNDWGVGYSLVEKDAVT